MCMAQVKAVLFSKAEFDALPEPLRVLYKEEAGQFYLDADGLEDHTFARGLKGALDGERGEKTKTARELQALKDKLGDLDPDEAREALKKIRDMEEAATLNEIPEKLRPKFDEAVRLRVEALQKTWEAKEKSYAQKIARLEQDGQSLSGKLAEITIDGAVREAASKAGIHEWAIDDAILRAKQVYKLKDGRPVPEKDGQVIFSGKSAGEPKPISEWLGEVVTERPGWLKPSVGTGAHNTGLSVTGSTVTLSRERARDPKAYQAAKEQAAKTGAELVIASQ